MLVIFTAAVPVSVNVTDCDPVDSPTLVAAKDRLVAESVNGSGTPVPLSVTVCGEVVALSVIVIAAVSAPPVVGPKCP